MPSNASVKVLLLLTIVSMVGNLYFWMPFTRNSEETTDYAPKSYVISSVEDKIDSIRGFRKRPSYVSKGHVCTSEQMKSQLAKARNMTRSEWSGWSGCSDTQFAKLYADMTKDVASKEDPIVIVNIGANKGYTVADKYAFWVPQSGINPRSMHSLIKKEYPSFSRACGACKECLFDGPSSLDIKREHLDLLKVFAVEPSITNVNLLRKVKDWIGSDSFNVVHAAGLDYTGTVTFPVTELGYEKGFVGQNPGKGKTTIEIPSITVDDFVKENNLRIIDILSIDTEGFDPLVLEGAHEVISNQKAKTIFFEYHMVGYWRRNAETSYKLEETVNFLDFHGYDCYIEGQDEVLRMTGCWDPVFEFRMWSNILCVLRSDRSVNQIAMSLAKRI